MVRVRIRCRDTSKIPSERLFGIGTKLFQVKIELEDTIDEEDVPVTEQDGKGDAGSNADKGNNSKGPPSKGFKDQLQMDTDKSSNSTTNKNPKSQGTANGPKTATCSIVPTEDADISENYLQEQLDQSLSEVKEDILAWMGAEDVDKDMCFNLLQQMELVDDTEQSQGYECDLSEVLPSQMQNEDGQTTKS